MNLSTDALPPTNDAIPPTNGTHPPRPRASAAIVVLAVLAIGYTLWAAQDLVLPLLLSMFLALIGNPILRGLRRIFIPRFIGALLLLALGVTGAVLLGRQLIGPAGEWMQQMPSELRVLTPKLRQMTQPMQQANQAAESFARAAGNNASTRKVQVVSIQEADPWKTLTATPKMFASVLAVVLLTFFFMTYGENLQRNAISLLPTRQRKKLTVDILQSIEHEMSRYVLTISVINALVGLALAGALYALGLPLQEALLWGTVASLLNFAPYVGPLVGVVLMLLMGFVTFKGLWPSLAPAGIYLALHTMEGQIITPIMLGRRMALSPLMLILALMLFGWLWGIVGLLLAVPLLVCIKIVLVRVEGLEGWAKLLE